MKNTTKYICPHCGQTFEVKKTRPHAICAVCGESYYGRYPRLDGMLAGDLYGARMTVHICDKCLKQHFPKLCDIIRLRNEEYWKKAKEDYK